MVQLPSGQLSSISNEFLVWEGRPSFRTLIPYGVLIVLLVIGVVPSALIGTLEVFVVALLVASIAAALALRLTAALGISLLDLIGVRYQLTNERVITSEDYVHRKIEEVDLVYFRATSVSQNALFRVLGVGNVYLYRENGAQPHVQFKAIRDPVTVKEMARHAIVDRRAQLGVSYRDAI